MTILLAPKVFLVLYALFQFYRAKKLGWLSIFHYWQIGICGYSLAALFVSGLLWDGVETLYYVCLAGFFVFFVAEIFRKVRSTQEAQAKRQTQLNEITQNLEEARQIMNDYKLQRTMEMSYDQR